MPITPSFGSRAPIGLRLKALSQFAPVFIWVFAWPAILAGAAVLFFGGRNFIRARESVTWPAVEGRVARSEMTLSTSGQHGQPNYHAEVLYNYQLSGATYSSNRIGFGDFDSSDPSHAQSILNRYPKGISVQVRYNPQSPELSVLETGVNGGTYILLLGGLLFFAMGCLTLWGLPRLLPLLSAAAPSDDSSN